MIPNNITLIKEYSSAPTMISRDMFDLANEISRIPKKEGVLILNSNKDSRDYNPKYIVPIFSGLSSHSVYFEPEIMEFYNTADEISNRGSFINGIEKMIIACDDPSIISKKLNEQMINTGNLYIVDLNNSRCFDKLANIKLVFRNSSYSIYKIL